MLHPHTTLELISPEIGYGVVATREIPRGTIIWVLDPLDQVLTDEKVAGLKPPCVSLVDRYTWTDANGRRILCWDFGRFINHSCEANTCGPGGLEFEIALRDIAVGEQLTCDYGVLNIEEPLRCACKSPRCRGEIRPDEFDVHSPEWDRRIHLAFPSITKVQQPLREWLTPEMLEGIEAGVADPRAIPSTLKHRWVGMPASNPGSR